MPIAGLFFAAIAFAIYAGLIVGISTLLNDGVAPAVSPLGVVLSALPFVFGISLIFHVWAGILSAPDRTLDRAALIGRYRRGAVIQGVGVAVVMALIILSSMMTSPENGSDGGGSILLSLALDAGLFVPVFLAGHASAWLAGFLKDQPQSGAHAYWEEVRARRRSRDEDQ